MQTRGAIYHHKDMVFEDGVTGTKFLILLNTPIGQDPYLFVKVTSQQKDKPVIRGCIHKKSLFFIPAGETLFPLNTWVQLHRIYPIPPERIDSMNGITLKGSLDVKTIDDIVNCLFLAQEGDLSIIFKTLLRPPIQAGILKLRERFKKNSPDRSSGRG